MQFAKCRLNVKRNSNAGSFGGSEVVVETEHRIKNWTMKIACTTQTIFSVASFMTTSRAQGNLLHFCAFFFSVLLTFFVLSPLNLIPSAFYSYLFCCHLTLQLGHVTRNIMSACCTNTSTQTDNYCKIL